MATVGILFCNPAPNSLPDEQDVLVQVDLVESALHDLCYKTERIHFVPNFEYLKSAIRNSNCSIVFNLVESIDGKGRHIYLAPAFLEMLEIEYCGCNPKSMLLTTDKIISKKLMRLHGVPTTDWCSINDTAGFAPEVPYIVKCVDEDASIGIDDNPLISALSAEDFHQQLHQKRAASGLNLFAETFVEGREFDIALTGHHESPTLYPVTERVFDNFDRLGKLNIYNYTAKWVKSSFEYQNTKLLVHRAFQEKDLNDRLCSIALQCWEIFDCEGYARVDFRVDTTGKIWVLEVNPNPCLSLDSTITLAALGCGLTYSRFIERIIESRHR